MSKDINNIVQGIAGFGEGFLETLASERERKQKELEFQQKMGLETRQMELLNNINLMQEKRLQRSEGREQDIQEYNIRSKYQELNPEPNAPLFPIVMGGISGDVRNQDFRNGLKPFREGKFYAPITEDKNPEDIWETINPNAVQNGKKGYLLRNKIDNTERFVDSYNEPSNSGNGNNKKDKPPTESKLSNKYEIDAFNRLVNPSIKTQNEFGIEIYADTPGQRNADFNIVANKLLTPDAMAHINKLKKGNMFPLISEIESSLDNPNLSESDLLSIEDFLKYYSQIEPTVRPIQTRTWWK